VIIHQRINESEYMFTVIIPTMWRSITFEEQLIALCNCEHIDEIILIDNDRENSKNFSILNNHKIFQLKPPKNLIVNKSWNIGVALSKNNNICLLNDDILFDMNIFEFMLNHTDKDLCGLLMDNENEKFELIESESRTHGFGCMMFVKKNSYENIPDTLLMLHGDDYLFYLNKKNGNKNYSILGCKNNKVWATTSGSELYFDSKTLEILYKEKETFERIMNEKNIILYRE
jgi:hypothetical protein